MSLPTWECGLKQESPLYQQFSEFVTPHVGVWIETIEIMEIEEEAKAVTPHVGVWIETTCSKQMTKTFGSLPTWECGLKQSV